MYTRISLYLCFPSTELSYAVFLPLVSLFFGIGEVWGIANMPNKDKPNLGHLSINIHET